MVFSYQVHTFTLWKIFLSKWFPTSILLANNLSISVTNLKTLVAFNGCLLTSSVSYVVSRLQIPIFDGRMIADYWFTSWINCWIIRIPWSISTFNRRWSYLKCRFRWKKKNQIIFSIKQLAYQMVSLIASIFRIWRFPVPIRDSMFDLLWHWTRRFCKKHENWNKIFNFDIDIKWYFLFWCDSIIIA